METEKVLGDRDLIVSSTDKKGIITYVNSTFSNISEYTKDELYGQPHNIIRHPDMPRAIFKYAWDRLLNHKPVVAYVKNYIKGKQQYYWVKAVIYPKVENNDIVSITSYRTKATTFEINQIKQIYKMLVEFEKNHSVDESLDYFVEYLKDKSLSYDKMINRLNDGQQILNKVLLNLNLNSYKTDYMIFRSRIESSVEKGLKDIEVKKPSDTKFGKRLQELENEEFAKDSKFLEAKKIHSRVHSQLEEYLHLDESKRDILMREVYKDINTLFDVMEELKNDHKYDQH